MEVVKHPLELEWGVTKETILDAIHQTAGYTMRSVRGVLAEHLLQPVLVAALPEWTVAKGNGKGATDYSIIKGDEEILIQCKMMRSEKGKPKYKDGCPVVECQKTSGKVKGKRLYKHDSFDILAVSLWPISKKWDDFAFCCAHHLTPRPKKADTINTMQNIDLPHGLWTRDIRLVVSRAAGKRAVRQTQRDFAYVKQLQTRP